jgi:hypothetical protein
MQCRFDGWRWSTASRALDLNEKSVVINHGKGGVNHDAEGTARNINVARVEVAAQQSVAASVSPRSGFAARHLQPKLQWMVRMASRGWATLGAPPSEPSCRCETTGSSWISARSRDSIRVWPTLVPKTPVQVPSRLTHRCSTGPTSASADFDQSFPDFFRFEERQREFDQQVKTNTFPSLTLLRLNHDHFGSFGNASFGVNTPELQMADNDYSVGLVPRHPGEDCKMADEKKLGPVRVNLRT